MHGSLAEGGDSQAAEAEVLPAHAVLLVEGRQLNDELLLFQVSRSLLHDFCHQTQAVPPVYSA